MSAPAFWGIDPDVRYLWTPRAGRAVVSEAVEASPAIPAYTAEDGAEVPAKPEIKAKAPVYGDALEGQPVLILSPLTERMSMRVTAARRKYFAAMSRSRAMFQGGADFNDAVDAFMDRIDLAYPEELQTAILADCVVGWQNVTKPGGEPIKFTGNWEHDARALPGWAKAELFDDIVTETAFTVEEKQAFTSPQESLTA